MERAGEGDEAPASPAPRDDGAAAKDEDWSEAIAAVVDAVDERMRLSEEHERFEVGGESPARETQDVGARTPRRREIPITAGPSRTPSPAGAQPFRMQVAASKVAKAAGVAEGGYRVVVNAGEHGCEGRGSALG